MGLFGKSKEQKAEAALRGAALRGDLATLKRLVQVGVDVNAKESGNGWTALMIAAHEGKLDCLEHLVAKGAKLDATDEDGETALMRVAVEGKLDCLEHLVAKGAKLDATDKDGWTALMFAAVEGKLDCLEHLVAKGAKLDATNNDGNTALMIAAREGKLDCLEHLVAKGAKLDATNKMTRSALHIAAYKGHAPCVEALLREGADARLKDEFGNTALDVAKRNGHTQVIALLQNAAAAAAQAEEALRDAAKGGDLATLKRLVEEGVNLEAEDMDGETALINAAYEGKLDCLEHLVAKGAKLDATDNKGATALIWAAYEGKLDCIEHLVAKGANLDATDKDGWTALINAAYEGKLDCLEHLAAKGAKLDATSKKKRSALHSAAYFGHAPCVEALLKAGADARLKDEHGDTALDDAKRKGHTQVIALLENAAAAAQGAAGERAAAERAAAQKAAAEKAAAERAAAERAAAERAAAQKAVAQKALEDEQLAWALQQSLLEQRATTAAPPAAAPPASAYAPAWVVPSAALRWERELGRGGFGAVYEVVHGGVRLAGKRVSLTVADERARIETLLKREFRALQQAQHPHIVRLHGVVTDDPSSVSLLMELSPIGSLRTLLDQRPAEVLQSEVAQLALLTGIALGMAHLHAQQPKPILHHDLKAANVLVWPDASTRFVAKISDFGLATGTHDSTMRTAQGTTGAATLAYKAPEAFDDEFTTASEVYAFGIVAWEVLTAKVPWEGYTQAKLTKAIIKEERPPLPPQGDFQLVKSCWAQEPKDRPTFATLARDLQAAAASTAKASEVPKSWTGAVDPLKTSVVELQPGAEYDRVTTAFMASLGGRGITVLTVARVQSQPMWTAYVAKRRSVLMREAQIDEAAAAARYERVWLFHGTDEETVPKICQMGFDRSFCGKNMTAFGKGVYFARDASYSSSTTYSRPNAQGEQHMFLARVVIGEYCRGMRDALAPPARDGAVLFDTTVNDVGNPTIFVTYRDAQAYPEYIVKFRQ